MAEASATEPRSTRGWFRSRDDDAFLPAQQAICTWRDLSYLLRSNIRCSDVTVCYLTLNDWSRGKQFILFPENVSRYEPNKTLRFERNKIKWFSDSPVTKRFVILEDAINRSIFAGNYALSSSDVIDFAMPAQRRFTGKRFSVKCYVTSN